MTTEKQTTPSQAISSDLPQDHPDFGRGGSYSFNPTTGVTTLIERAGFVPDQSNQVPAIDTTQPLE
jgi:hypothetical protein